MASVKDVLQVTIVQVEPKIKKNVLLDFTAVLTQAYPSQLRLLQEANVLQATIVLQDPLSPNFAKTATRIPTSLVPVHVSYVTPVTCVAMETEPCVQLTITVIR